MEVINENVYRPEFILAVVADFLDRALNKEPLLIIQ